MITDGNDVKCLTDHILRAFLDKEATEFAAPFNQDELSRMVKSTLKTDMSDKSATGSMKLLFMNYKSLLRADFFK